MTTKEVALDYQSSLLGRCKSPQLEMQSFMVQNKSIFRENPIPGNQSVPEQSVLLLKGVRRYKSWSAG